MDFTTDCSWARAVKTPCSYPPRPLTRSWDSGPQPCTPCQPGNQPQGLVQSAVGPTPSPGHTLFPRLRATGWDPWWGGRSRPGTQAPLSVSQLVSGPLARAWPVECLVRTPRRRIQASAFVSSGSGSRSSIRNGSIPSADRDGSSPEGGPRPYSLYSPLLRAEIPFYVGKRIAMLSCVCIVF